MLTSPTNTTNLQHLNMTIETSDEVSTRQEVGMESSFRDSLGRRGGFVEGRLETLENCSKTHHYRLTADYENDHGDDGRGEFASGFGGRARNCGRLKEDRGVVLRESHFQSFFSLSPPKFK